MGHKLEPLHCLQLIGLACNKINKAAGVCGFEAPGLLVQTRNPMKSPFCLEGWPLKSSKNLEHGLTRTRWPPAGSPLTSVGSGEKAVLRAMHETPRRKAKVVVSGSSSKRLHDAMSFAQFERQRLQCRTR